MTAAALNPCTRCNGCGTDPGEPTPLVMPADGFTLTRQLWFDLLAVVDSWVREEVTPAELAAYIRLCNAVGHIPCAPGRQRFAFTRDELVATLERLPKVTVPLDGDVKVTAEAMADAILEARNG